MTDRLPHEQVYVRLAPSKVHGIGVFAIRPIARGTDIFANDKVEMVWVDAAHIDRAGLSDEQKRLYHDFGINRGDRIGCPVNFNNLTPGWYLNEPGDGQEASVRVDQHLSFLAARNIEEGEELSVLYSGFSDSQDR